MFDAEVKGDDSFCGPHVGKNGCDLYNHDERGNRFKVHSVGARVQIEQYDDKQNQQADQCGQEKTVQAEFIAHFLPLPFCSGA
jgi:hypothetical protein